MEEKEKEIKSNEKTKSESEGFYDEYAASRNTIRVWFVTFGIGGLYLLLTNEKLMCKLKSTGDLKCIATLFLIGIGAQLFIAIINKWVNWYIYYFDQVENWFSKIIDDISSQFWIDIICDIATCFCFGEIIWKMLNIFSS